MSLMSTSMLGAPQTHHAGYPNDALLDELSRQLHSAGTRRLPKISPGSQRLGGSMRITKPGSANNSPRSAVLQSRRRTMVGDGPHGRFQPQPMDSSYLQTQTPNLPQEPRSEGDGRPARPVSWHPSSQQFNLHEPYPLQAPMTNIYPQCSDGDAYTSYQAPPTPVAYSAYASPSSTFSPPSLALSNGSSQGYFSPSHRTQPAHSAPSFPSERSPARDSRILSDMPYLPAPKVGGPLSWDSFVVHGFDGRSTPPTPEDFVQASKPETKLAAEDSIPYEPLEDDESEGEILYGMGLYDAPDKNPLLDFHRSTVFSLLGSGIAYPEPTGKGLKLEDAWEPPASEDEADNDDGEDDAEGDDD